MCIGFGAITQFLGLTYIIIISGLAQESCLIPVILVTHDEEIWRIIV
jgi:hypothetical protein